MVAFNAMCRVHSHTTPYPPILEFNRGTSSDPQLSNRRATADESPPPPTPLTRPTPSQNPELALQSPKKKTSSMASHFLPPLALSVLLPYLLFFTPVSADLRLASAPDSSEKVSLGLYYESLCPYSANFIVNYLVKIFENGLISVVDLNLVPWGNAKILANGTFDCQHGPLECLLDTIEGCAINVWPDLDDHFPFIYCVEALVHEHNYHQWETCFDKLGLDPTPISECYSSGRGKELQLQYAAETNALQPPHKYVPWVVVDGQPLYEDYENFISYICKAYKGTAVLNACSNLDLNTMPEEKVNPSRPVCYEQETIKSRLAKIRSAITSWRERVVIAVLQYMA